MWIVWLIVYLYNMCLYTCIGAPVNNMTKLRAQDQAEKWEKLAGSCKANIENLFIELCIKIFIYA